jgi:hypothetical protein
MSAALSLPVEPAIVALPHGLHRDVPADVYHSRVPGMVSKSALDLVRRSPLHYKSWLDGIDEEPTPALAFGSAFHCALLEPLVFAKAYAVEPDFGDCRKKENKAERDAWRAQHASAIPLSADDNLAIRAMVAAVRSHPLAGKMIQDGDPELTIRWRDGDTGLEGKCRADYHVKRLRMAVDVKSAIDASPDAFRKAVANFGYHRQDALYRKAFAAVGEPIDHFVFVAVEKTAPYAVGVYSLDAEGVARGHSSVMQDMVTLAECARSNTFPGYAVEIQTLHLPAWAA